MTDELRAQWGTVEEWRARILQAVGRLPEAAQNHARPGAWSSLDILEHLIRVEETQLEQNAAAKEAQGVPHRTVPFRTLVWTLRKGIPLPVPKELEPAGGRDFETLNARWEDVRARMARQVEAARDDRPFLVHPQLGPMSAEMALELTAAHLQYHARQLGA